MASTINATTTGVGGVVVSGDNSGELVLQTNNGVAALSFDASQNATFSATVVLSNQAEIQFADADSSNHISFQAPAVVPNTVSFTLPSADGTNGQAIITNGSGTLSFGSAGISTGKSIAMAMIFGF